MAVTIVNQKSVCDGYDALLSDGSVVHFQSKPKDIEAAVAGIVAAREVTSAKAAGDYEILGESDG